MSTLYVLAQCLNYSSNLYNRNDSAITWHGMPNRLQASGDGARKVLSTTPYMKIVIRHEKYVLKHTSQGQYCNERPIGDTSSSKAKA